MSIWNSVRNSEEITELMDNFGGFDKSCIISVAYKSGAYVGEIGEHFINDDMTVSVVLQRKSLGYVQSIELFFRDIKLLRLEPLGSNYECYLTDASVKCENGIVTFTNWDDFDTINADAGVLIIKAGSMMWRDVSEKMSYTA